MKFGAFSIGQRFETASYKVSVTLLLTTFNNNGEQVLNAEFSALVSK